MRRRFKFLGSTSHSEREGVRRQARTGQHDVTLTQAWPCPTRFGGISESRRSPRASVGAETFLGGEQKTEQRSCKAASVGRVASGPRQSSAVIQ